ncbi:MAG: hypothetical protein VW771_07885, partial [Gammaproteobacteria bacterium]
MAHKKAGGSSRNGR